VATFKYSTDKINWINIPGVYGLPKARKYVSKLFNKKQGLTVYIAIVCYGQNKSSLNIKEYRENNHNFRKYNEPDKIIV
jgi:hypothetical protein